MHTALGVGLQYGGRHLVGHGAQKGLLDDLRLARSVGQQDHQLGFQNLGDALGDALRQRQVPSAEVFLLDLPGDGAEGVAVGAQGEVHAVFVEAQVAVHADAQHLHVDGAAAADERVLPPELRVDVRGAAVKQKGVRKGLAHGLQQLCADKVGTAALVPGADAHPVVQLHEFQRGGIDLPAAYPLDKQLQHSHRRIAAGKADQRVGLAADLLFHQVGRAQAQRGILFRDDDLHLRIPLFHFLRGPESLPGTAVCIIQHRSANR
jgi:hypothetical protein